MKNNTNISEKQNMTSRSKKNKKMFVYNPSQDQEKCKEVQTPKKPEVKEFVPVPIPPLASVKKSNQAEPKKNNKENTKNKRKMQFVYNPSEDKEKEHDNSQKQNNVKNNDNYKYNNNKNNNKSSNKKIENSQINQNLQNNKSHDTNCIEININSQDSHNTNPLDWIPIIRDALFKSLERNIEIIKFILCKMLQSNQEMLSSLHVLVLLTAKRLGFESSINSNKGEIICKISSHNNSTTFVPYMPTKEEQEYLNTNDTLLKAFGLNKEDNLNIDNLAFRAVKTRFPHMPTICIAIICVHRNPKEAVEFAQLFEDYLRVDDFQQSLEIEERNEKGSKEIKMIQLLEKKYGLDHDQLMQIYDQISSQF